MYRRRQRKAALANQTDPSGLLSGQRTGGYSPTELESTIKKGPLTGNGTPHVASELPGGGGFVDQRGYELDGGAGRGEMNAVHELGS